MNELIDPQFLDKMNKKLKGIETNDPDDISDDLYAAVVDEAERIIREHHNNIAPNAEIWTADHAHWASTISIEEAITSNEFLGQTVMSNSNIQSGVYPAVLEDCIELWEERKKRPIFASVFEESFGSGKTFKASILLWLQWFDLCKYLSPQRFFNLNTDSWMCFMCFSRTESLARKVCFTEVWNRFNCAFNRRFFPPMPSLKREIKINVNRTVVYAGTSSALSAIGYNLIGGTCLSGRQKIKLADGSAKPLSELENCGNVKIVGFDNNVFKEVTAKDVIKTGEKEIFEVELEDRSKILATKDHKFLTYFGYKRLYKMTEHMYLTTDRNTYIKIKTMKSLGVESVFDIVGSETSNFVLENGVVAHNCDEANFLEVVEDSKRKSDDIASKYDEAQDLFDQVILRMTSRTLRPDGTLPGFLSMISSARYKNDFTDRMIQKARRLGKKSGIFYKRRATYESKPKWMYPSGKYFYVDTDSYEYVPEEAAQKYYEVVSAIRDSCIVSDEVVQNLKSRIRSEEQEVTEY